MDGGRDRCDQRDPWAGYRSAPGVGIGPGGTEDRNGVRGSGGRAGGVCQDSGTIGIGALPGPAGAGGQAVEAVAQEPIAAGDDFDRLGRVQGKLSEQSADTVGVVALADIPDSGASGSGPGGDVRLDAVGREYRLDAAVQRVIGLCDRGCVEVQWLIIIL